MKKSEKLTCEDLDKEIKSIANPERAKSSQRFFKTGIGEYAEGDIFVGLSVPQIRILAKKYSTLPLAEIKTLLKSNIHEERLIALLILNGRFKKGDEKEQEKIFKLYLVSTKHINNWDLVDSSAEYIVGAYLSDKDRSLLEKLARSKSLWERRIAIISTFYFLKRGEFKDTIKIATLLLKDEEDLIHKATGWMLREMGKRGGEKELRKFLDKYSKKMPRTMLRYSLEKFSAKDRAKYMKR